MKVEVTALPSFEEKEEQFREQVLQQLLETCHLKFFLHKCTTLFSK